MFANGAITSAFQNLFNDQGIMEEVQVTASGYESFSDRALGYIKKNLGTTIGVTAALSNALNVGGTAKISAKSFSGKYPEVYAGAGAVRGQSIRGTVDLTVYGRGAIDTSQPVVKMTACAGVGLGGCIGSTMGSGGEEITVSFGFVEGISKSVTVGRPYSIGPAIEKSVDWIEK